MALLLVAFTCALSRLSDSTTHGSVFGVQCAYAREAPRLHEAPWDNEYAGQDGARFTGNEQPQGVFRNAASDTWSNADEPTTTSDTEARANEEEDDAFLSFNGRRVREDFDIADLNEVESLIEPDVVREEALAAAEEVVAHEEKWPAGPGLRVVRTGGEDAAAAATEAGEGLGDQQPAFKAAGDAYGDAAANENFLGDGSGVLPDAPPRFSGADHVGGTEHRSDETHVASPYAVRHERLQESAADELGGEGESAHSPGSSASPDSLHGADGSALPTHTEDVLIGPGGDSSVRDARLPTSLGEQGGKTLDSKREVQARWRELRGSYPTLRELIWQLVDAYKEEQRIKRACLTTLVSRRRNTGTPNSTRPTYTLSEAECAAQLPRLRTSLDWVRYLPYVPIYPIDEALKHLEHEKDDDILLALFYAPDMFNTYNYIQWIGLMVKATCSLLRAGVLDPIANISDDKGDYRAAFAGVAGSTFVTNTSDTHKKGNTSDAPLFCPHLTLPSMEGLLDAEDVQRLRTNMVRIAIIDGYYPQRNVSRRLWERMSIDTYMVNQEVWDIESESGDISSSSSSSGGDWDVTAGTPPSAGDNADRLPISEALQRSSEDWGPVFVEHRNALLRLLAHEGGLFEEVQGALWPGSRPRRSGDDEQTDNPADDVTREQRPTDQSALPPSPPPQHQQQEQLRGDGVRQGSEEVEQQRQSQEALTRLPQDAVDSPAFSAAEGVNASNDGGAAASLRMIDALSGNDRIHFLARYIIEHTDDLIVTRPTMLLDVLQRSFDRIRRREQRLVEKIFSWGQIMKYRVHVNVSAQRIDEFSSDHLCEVRYHVYLHSPQSMEGNGGSAADTPASRWEAGGRRGAPPTFWTGEQRGQSDEQGDDYDFDGLGRSGSCYYYQQLRNSRTTAALGSVSRLQRKAKRRSAILASASLDGGDAQGGETREGDEEGLDTKAEVLRHVLHHHDPNRTNVPRYRKAPSDASATERSEGELRGDASTSLAGSADDDDDGSDIALTGEWPTHTDGGEDLHEVYVQYVDSIDELALEEDEHAGSPSDRLNAASSARSEMEADLREITADAVSTVSDRDEKMGEEGSPRSSSSPRSVPGTPVNSLHLIGTAARRNYLLRQNPPVLLFPRKQGSRPYFFPQTLLQMVHLSFSGPRGQLPLQEHASRLRSRWGCAEAAQAPLNASDEVSCSNAAARSCDGDRSRGARITPNSTSSPPPSSDASSTFTAVPEGASATMAPPTPFTYRVVSALDNPFSRIGVEHLHYEFVISGPSSPTSVLQLLIEEARRVSTPGELEVRSHREALYRLQHRQWLEAQQKQRAAEAAKHKQARREEATRGATCRIDNASCAAPGTGESVLDSFTLASDSTMGAGEEPREVYDRMPESELAQREYGGVARTWGERMLASTAKDLHSYLQQGTSTPLTNSSGPVGSNGDGGDEAGDAASSSGPSERRSGATTMMGSAGGSGEGGLTGTLGDEAEGEEYFFEHDISFRLDPDRFIENAPLTLHFFLRTPTHIVETEIIEPLQEHIRVLQRRLVEDILADVFQYARCHISGNRYVQLLRHGADAHYVNGSRVPVLHNASDDTPPPLPYAYTEDGLPLLRCMRSSAAVWVWRLAAEMQQQEVQHASDHEEDDAKETAMEDDPQKGSTAAPHPVPLPRDAASYLELLHMPYDVDLEWNTPAELYTDGNFDPEDLPVLPGRFRRSRDASASAADLTDAQRAQQQNQRFTQERLLLMQLAFRELMKRSNSGSTESFFQLVAIDREAAMPVSEDDPSRTVYRTLPSSISSTSSLPVPGPEPVRPRSCLSSYNTTYMAITYLFFNGTAERHFRGHPLNRRRVRLMQRLNEAIRLSRQARLILLTATEDDYRTQYLDSVIQDAARRFFVLRQINRIRDTALRDWELRVQRQLQREMQQHEQTVQQQQHEQGEVSSFSTGRGEADDGVFPSSAGAHPSREAAGWRPTSRSRHSGAATTAERRGAGGGGGAASSGDFGEDEELSGLGESFDHLSPFHFNIINYDFDASDSDPLRRQGGGEAAPAATEKMRGGRRASSPSSASKIGATPPAETSDDVTGVVHRSTTKGTSRECQDGDVDCVASWPTGAHAEDEHLTDDEMDAAALSSPSFASSLDYTATADEQQIRVLHSGAVVGGRKEAGRSRGRWSMPWFSSPDSSNKNREHEGAEEQTTDHTNAAERRFIQAEMTLLDEEMQRLQHTYLGGDHNGKNAHASLPPQEPNRNAELLEGAPPPPPAPPEGSFARWRALLFGRGKDQGATASPGHDSGTADDGDEHLVQDGAATSREGGRLHGRNSEDTVQRRSHVWQRRASDLFDDEDADGATVSDFMALDEFEQGGDDDADISHVISGGKTEYEEGLPFPWRHGEVPQQELRRRLDEHQRHVRELKRRLIDVRLRWASALWNERERPGAAQAATPPSQSPEKEEKEG